MVAQENQPIRTDKYFIAENYEEFRAHLSQRRLIASDKQYISRTEHLMGRRLHPSQIEVVGDPRLPYSFWMQLTRATITQDDPNNGK